MLLNGCVSREIQKNEEAPRKTHTLTKGGTTAASSNQQQHERQCLAHSDTSIMVNPATRCHILNNRGRDNILAITPEGQDHRALAPIVRKYREYQALQAFHVVCWLRYTQVGGWGHDQDLEKLGCTLAILPPCSKWWNILPNTAHTAAVRDRRLPALAFANRSVRIPLIQPRTAQPARGSVSEYLLRIDLSSRDPMTYGPHLCSSEGTHH